jgi:phosphoribosylaminoimidazolecarboxamide formyltransferase/IMP cyclohydrolase
MNKTISSALISVYHKENLDGIIKGLHELGVKLYATGGTQEFIEELKIPVIAVETITDFPSILGGRVKTLHPRIFGGILGRRQNTSDVAEMEEFHIPEIDLVIVDLYPFEETVAAGKNEEAIIEKIDIGGISLIRAAAKNFNDVLIIPSADQYSFLARILDEKKGVTSIEDRRLMSACAFNVSSHYDSSIFKYFNNTENLPVFKESVQLSKSLRYGENPHQKAVFYGDLEKMFEQINGKEISYNNLLDIDAGISLINEFDEPTVVIIKHNNACGLASAPTIEEAWRLALEGDPVSAFGGVIISNRKIELVLASEINKIFFEVAIAPSFQSEASDLLRQKKNRILLIQKKNELPARQFRTILNGVVEQERDTHTERKPDMKTVTLSEPSENQYADLEFANKIVKHLKSNTIVLAKNKQLLGSGTGQTSRVDALKQAITKAGQFGLSLQDSVMASDAFFPFPDCVEIAGRAGVKAIIQPGGSIKDGESIDYCNFHHLVMVMTGYRHFKH